MTKSAFQQMLEDDAAAVFLNTDEFAELITYTPSGAAAITNMKALVNRNPGSDDPTLQVRQGRAQAVIEVEIANSTTYGRTTIKEKFDKVTVADKQGSATTKTYTVSAILSQDFGMWLLECTG